MEFAFVAGNLALDFVATVASRDTVAVERVPTPAALAEWFALSGAVSEPPEVSSADYSRAIALREALYPALRARASAAPVDEETVALVNSLASRPTPVPELVDGRIRTFGSAEGVLALIARAAQNALTDPRLRFCDGQDCTRPFVDASRGRTRRWCGMAGCGDRAKAAAYRRRVTRRPRNAGAED
ncbi:CGNR zinc finger domain-containing protein [Microbacterium sp. NPDC077057]|uniref:CGNR zinc finger domain-containing protein n=1 Tax=unclassified Microbacterium TaxID=2609290 RepID=UPI0034218F29